MKTLNCNIHGRDKNINKVRTYRIITKAFNTSCFKIVNNNIFAYCRSFFSNSQRRRVKMPISISSQNSLIHNNRIKKRTSNLLSFGLDSKTFACFFSFSKIGMRYFSNIASHFASLIIFPFVCIYPLSLYCITSVSNWYVKIVEQSRNSSIVSKFPTLTKFSERIKLNRVKFIQDNRGGAPLDGLNSFNVFFYKMFFHNEFNLVTSTNIQQYSGNIYNLSVENDETYITDIGIVHNCRCKGDPVDDQFIRENNLSITNGKDILTKDDPETGKPYISKDFRFNPGKTGTMPNDSSYSEMLPSANSAGAKLFEEPISNIINWPEIAVKEDYDLSEDKLTDFVYDLQKSVSGKAKDYAVKDDILIRIKDHIANYNNFYQDIEEFE